MEILYLILLNRQELSEGTTLWNKQRRKTLYDNPLPEKHDLPSCQNPRFEGERVHFSY